MPPLLFILAAASVHFGAPYSTSNPFEEDVKNKPHGLVTVDGSFTVFIGDDFVSLRDAAQSIGGNSIITQTHI